MKSKKCKICKESFEPKNSLQVVCKSECAIEYGRIHLKRTKIESAKKQRLERKELKETIKTSKDYRNDLQRKINTLIRSIDEGCKCISIDCNETTHMEAGHFRAVGAGIGSPIRFNLLNIFFECKSCNKFKGSKYSYYDGLIETFGDDIFQVIHDLPTIWKELKLNIEELKEASKNATECLKFVKAFKSDKQLPLNNSDRILLRVKVNELMGIYK
jgi:hypothetical protein